MSYSKTHYGPGAIAALASGTALGWGPTIGSNDPTSPLVSGGSRGAYPIPSMAGCQGCGLGNGSTGGLSQTTKLLLAVAALPVAVYLFFWIPTHVSLDPPGVNWDWRIF